MSLPSVVKMPLITLVKVFCRESSDYRFAANPLLFTACFYSDLNKNGTMAGDLLYLQVLN